MKKTAIPILIVLILFLNQCNNSEVKKPAKIVEEKKIKLSISINKIMHISLSNISYPGLFFHKDSLYLYAFGKNESRKDAFVVYKLDADLQITFKKVLNFGQGPGDVGGGPRFTGSGEYIYLTDNTQRTISVFNQELNFIKQVKCNHILYSSQFFDNGQQFIATKSVKAEQKKSTHGTKRECCIFSFPGLSKTVFQIFGPYYPIDPDTKKFVLGAEAGYQFFIWRDHIYYLNMTDYLIKKFDLEGNLLNEIQVNTPTIFTSKDNEEKKILGQSGDERHLLRRMKLADTVQPASWMVPLGKGIAIVRRNSYDTDCSDLVECDYFDSDLNLLGKINLPCFNFIYRLRRSYFADTFAYHNGYLYVLNDFGEDMELQKWEVME